jgi:transposase
MSDYKAAALKFDVLAKTKVLFGDRDYDAGGLRQALAASSVSACIPSKINRKVPILHDVRVYRSRYKVEILFAWLKDWRCIPTRYVAATTPNYARAGQSSGRRTILAESQPPSTWSVCPVV